MSNEIPPINAIVMATKMITEVGIMAVVSYPNLLPHFNSYV